MSDILIVLMVSYAGTIQPIVMPSMAVCEARKVRLEQIAKEQRIDIRAVCVKKPAVKA